MDGQTDGRSTMSKQYNPPNTVCGGIIILKSIHWSRRCHLKVLIFLAVVAILFSGA